MEEPRDGKHGAAVAAVGPTGRRALPRVSVVIPSKDRPDFLRRSVQTALQQVDVTVEVIVVDDGGQVPAAEYLDLDPRVRVLRNPVAQGVSRARNRGLAAANFDWIAFLDDDDLWAPHKLATQVAQMTAENRRWSHSGTVRLTAALKVTEITHPDTTFAEYPSILQVNGVATPSAVVIDAALLDETGGFDPAFSTMADWDLWIRAAQLATAAVVDEPLVGYVVHPGSMHRQGTRGLLRELHAVKAKYRGGPPVAGPYVWKWIADTHRRTGHPITCLPLYALPVFRSPMGIWRTRRVIARGAAGHLARILRLGPPAQTETEPAWLAHLSAAPQPAPDRA